MKRILSFIFTLLFFVGLSAKNDPSTGKYKVIPVDSLSNIANNCVTYALPKTAVKLHLTESKTTRIRGPFYQYSERYLGLKDVILKDEVVWDIVDVEMEPVGIADETKRYAIFTEGSATIPTLHFAENGCISSINGPAIPTIKEIEKEIMLGGSQQKSFDFVPYTEEMLVANSTAKMALEAATYIKRIRENRTLLISGEATHMPDGEGLALALQQMDELEQQFLELFKGKEITEVVEQTVTYLPQKEVERDLVFRFSKFKGIVAKDDLSGEPVHMKVSVVAEKVYPSAMPQKEYDAKGKLIKDIPDLGLFYRLPANVNLELSVSNNVISDATLKLAQFGQETILPVRILNDANTVIFNSTNGSIQSIEKK